MRENGEVTKEIPDSAKFLTASADGSRVLLADGHLFNVGDLQEPPIDLDEGDGGFVGIAGQSEDLSHIYFVDTAILTGGQENDHGAKAQADENNLYAWHEGSVLFIATLAASRHVEGNTFPGDEEFFGSGDWASPPAQRSAEASPDGRWLTFLSVFPLTGYDNTGTCEAQGAIGSCSEVFIYDSATGGLDCASCNPSNQRPLGSSSLPVILATPEAEDPLPQMQYLTDMGRLYFNSRDSLTPFDTNKGVEDVYEYEPQGIGSCARADGCVSLISAGKEPVDSDFLAMDESGKNVFFTTRDRLVPKDHDELIDVYDAREGGGISGESEAAASECQGETCQTPPPPPNDQTPGSTVFSGPGNLIAGLEKISASKKTVVVPKKLTPAQMRAQRLASALRVCRVKAKPKRAGCEAQARKRYGVKKKSKVAVKRSTKGDK